MKRPDWQLRARSGRAVLARDDQREVDPARLWLPGSLVTALHEWAHIAAAVQEASTGEPDDAAAVSRRGRQLAMRLAAETGGRIGYLDPLSGEQEHFGRSRPATAVPLGGAEVLAAPTPWVPGLMVGTIIAAIVTVTLVVVSRGLADVSVVLSVLINIAIAAGFAPSIWLGRRIPVWRWVAYGTAAGLAASWLALLLDLLG